jgi:Asp-tRNA(Asn)/Glu-tRNA(Gln) amidotransferase C subunit|tara:strand:+ start:41 stop:889 length:849 start_codon:yes stop_codon:yes gene_type:complete
MKKNNLLILTALKAEAIPIIHYYGLKKKEYSKYISVYSTENINLLITGVGKTNVQKTIRNFCNIHNLEQKLFTVNIGSAGGNPDHCKIGDIFLINKITDENNRTSFYPDVLFKHGMEEFSLTTVKNPAINGHRKYDSLVDMEASAIWNLFKSRIPVHRMLFIKVISDFMNIQNKKFEDFEKLVVEILNNQLKHITNLVSILQNVDLNDIPTFSKNEIQFLKKVSTNLRLTETQKIKLDELAENRKYIHDDIFKRLNPFSSINSNDKHHRNEIFKKICSVLST